MARQITNEGKLVTNNKYPTAQDITTIITSVKTNYTETISGQIDRIGDAHEIMQAKAYEMKLNVQANQGDSKSTSAVRLQKDGSHQIMDTASAINSINVQPFLLKAGNNYVSSDSTTLTSGIEYKIPVGYNTTELTIELPSLVGNATVNQVLSGKTFYNDSYTKQTGTMPNRGNEGGSVGLNGTYTISEGYHDGTGVVTGPVVDIQDVTSLSSKNGGLAVNSNNATATIEISRYKNPDGSTGNIARSVTIPRGYYSQDITLTPTFKDNSGNIENILNYADLSVSGVLDFTNNNKIFYPQEDNGVDYYGNVTISKAIINSQANGTSKVTSSGWVNENDIYGNAYGGYPEYTSHTLTARDNNKFGTSTTISSGNITTLTKQYYTDVITKGHTDGETKYLKVQDCSFSLTTTINGNTIYQPTITKNSETNVASSSAITTKPSSGYYVAVESSANTNSAKAIASINTHTPGWKSVDNDTTFEKNFTIKTNASKTTYIPINASTITANITGTTKVTPTIIEDPNIEQKPVGASPISDAKVSTTPPDSGYYFKVITEAISNNITPIWSATAGYTPETSGSGTAIAVGANASESHYIKIPAATLRSVTATKNQSSNKLEFSGGKSVSDGYVTTSTAQNLPANINGWNGSIATSATSGTNQVYSNTITANNQDLYIKQGVYLTKDIKINKVNAGIGKITSANSIQNIQYIPGTNKASATYKPNNDADTANNPTYFSSVEVDVTDIVKALMAI